MVSVDVEDASIAASLQHGKIEAAPIVGNILAHHDDLRVVPHVATCALHPLDPSLAQGIR
jgi:hypothetical protein